MRCTIFNIFMIYSFVFISQTSQKGLYLIRYTRCVLTSSNSPGQTFCNKLLMMSIKQREDERLMLRGTVSVRWGSHQGVTFQQMCSYFTFTYICYFMTKYVGSILLHDCLIIDSQYDSRSNSACYRTAVPLLVFLLKACLTLAAFLFNESKSSPTFFNVIFQFEFLCFWD